MTLLDGTIAGATVDALIQIALYAITPIFAMFGILFDFLNRVKRILFGPHIKATSVLITGANSGIGEALALEYAATPGAFLALTGRDQTRLDDIVKRCKALGAKVVSKTLDVTNETEMRNWIREVDAKVPLDLVIANAGVSESTAQVTIDKKDGSSSSSSGEAAKLSLAEKFTKLNKTTRTIFDINVDGVFNTVQPVIDRMVERKSGQIALMASLASFQTPPGFFAYSASKHAVRSYGEGLRNMLSPFGVSVNVITPGFVESNMTASLKNFPMLMIMTAERAAKIIRLGLAHNDSSIGFPRPMYALALLVNSITPGARALLWELANLAAGRRGKRSSPKKETKKSE